jgi:hypothetical protein
LVCVTVYCDGRMDKLRRPLRSRGGDEDLLSLLNHPSPSPMQSRVSRILELLHEAERLRGGIYRLLGSDVCRLEDKTRPYPNGFITDRTFDDPAIQSMHDRYKACLAELNERLSRYRWRAMIWDSEYFWLARMWVPATGKKYSEMVEELAIDTLLRETQGERSRTFYPDIPTGAVRYRRCDRCGKWLYAKVEKQRFCGDNCRKSFAAQNPAFKEQRRLYMTKRRQDEKEKQKSSLERARRELRRR